ncbi:MAG TPA: molybdate ABC transporter substrate-binding protein [Thermomicrobiales bacterium]|nr:molybdate ABC transporter substrate-binding protein [Thermomicrobiales bacterium]
MKQRSSQGSIAARLRHAMRALMLVPMLMLGFLMAPGAAGIAAAATTIDCPPATPAAASSASASASPTLATPAAATEFPTDGGSLTVYAAASLTDAFGKIGDQITAAHPNVKISFQTGGSQALVTQLQQGAKGDVLATANTSTMASAVKSNLIDGSPITFTGNRLVIVTPTDNPASITSFDDLAKSGTKLVLAAPDVPAGNYAVKAICQHQQDVSGFAGEIGKNVVSEEEDVRTVLSKVQTGEADAGIVYYSDAVASELSGTKLNVIEFPATVPTYASYPIAPIAGGNTDLANAFIAYVLGPDGQKVLKDYGFETLAS